MVRQVKYMLAFFRLIRIQNLLIIAVTMYLLRWFVVKPVFDNLGFQSLLDGTTFFLLVFATVCTTAAGYVINDYFDRKADLINRPGSVILGRILRRRAGVIWHWILTVTGIAVGTYVAKEIGVLKLGLLFFVVSGILWFYSTTYKRQVLLGNIIVSLLVACIPVLVVLFELPLFKNNLYLFRVTGSHGLLVLLKWILGYSVFAFLLTLIREIVKDLEDFEGDFAFGRQTIPIAWGVKAAKYIILGSGLATVLLILVALFYYKWSIVTLIYGILFILIPLLGLLYKTIKANSQNNYHFISVGLKIIMLAGLLYIAIAAFLVY